MKSDRYDNELRVKAMRRSCRGEPPFSKGSIHLAEKINKSKGTIK